MTITVASAKSKGRRLQNWVRDLVLKTFPSLHPDDVKSAVMGESGVDIKLSPAARKLFNYAVECKAHAKHSVYTLYDQAVANQGTSEPLLIIKGDRRKPLAIIDAEHLFALLAK